MIAACAAALVLSLADDRVFESPEQGFAIERPATWRFQVLEQNEQGAFEVKAYPPARDGLVAASVEVKPAGGVADSGAAADAAIALVQNRDGYSEVERIEGEVGGRELSGIRVLYDAPRLGEFRIRQLYLVEGARLYVLETHAPKDEYDDFDEELEGVLATFRRLEPTEELAREDRLRALAARCAEDVPWASSWAEAAARAKAEKKPVLVATQLQRGFDLMDTVRTITFADPDFAALARARCVPLHFRAGMDAPFVDQGAYGMGPMTFGTALLLVSPAGEVLRETPTLDPKVAYPLLVEWLAAHEELPGEPVPPWIRAEVRAELLLERGELDAAMKALSGLDGARAWLVRTRVHRLRREGEGAVASVEAARMFEDAEEVARALDEEEMLAYLRLGRDASARRLAKRLVRAEEEAAPAARYWLGVLATRSSDYDEAREHWEALTEEHPDDPWAFRAAAALTSPLLDLELPVVTEYPLESSLAAMGGSPYAPGEVEHLAEVERDALAWLLDQQSEDGSWLGAWRSGRYRDREESDPFADSITSIAGMAVLARRGTPGADGAEEAVRRALDYVLGARERRADSMLPVVFMDYSAYADAWAIRFLADCLDEGIGSKGALRRAIEDHVAALGEKRQANGGWSYYLSGQAEAGAAPARQSISFITALVARALVRAEAVGVEVPAEVRDGALDCLEAMRHSSGAFEYMLFAGRSATGAQAPGAAFRGPLCELALLEGGRGDRDRVRAALGRFEHHRDPYERQLGKSLMHCGPEGQGSHYLFFDYVAAAEAIAALPEEERGPYRALLTELVLDARTEAGWFRDTPLNGQKYGTAMALLALDALRAGDDA